MRRLFLVRWITNRCLGFALALLLFECMPAMAQDLIVRDDQPSSSNLTLTIGEDSRIWFEGGSTVRGFECRVRELRTEAAIELKTPNVEIAALNDAVVDVVLEMPVANLDCGNGTMNDHMRKALRADKHPIIQYRHGTHAIVTSQDGVAQLRLEGALTINGVERPVVMMADVAIADDGTLSVEGQYELIMTEYGVKPPTLMLGTLKVHDTVTIYFDMKLRP